MAMRSPALLLAVLTACGSSGGGGNEGPGNGGTPTYSRDIQPILLEKCAPCHTTDAEGGFNHATDYEATQQQSGICFGSMVYQCMLILVREGTMPENAGCTGDAVADDDNPSCLNAAEQELLADWVAAGAPEGGAPAPRPDADPDDTGDTGDPGGW